MIGFIAMEEPVSFYRKDSISICRYHASGHFDLDFAEVGEPFVRIKFAKSGFRRIALGFKHIMHLE